MLSVYIANIFIKIRIKCLLYTRQNFISQTKPTNQENVFPHRIEYLPEMRTSLGNIGLEDYKAQKASP